MAEIYPELVVRDTNGQPLSVRYHVLPAMLLNELQRQQRDSEARFAAHSGRSTSYALRFGRSPMAGR
jgi:hypothetical protein